MQDSSRKVVCALIIGLGLGTSIVLGNWFDMITSSLIASTLMAIAILAVIRRPSTPPPTA